MLVFLLMSLSLYLYKIPLLSLLSFLLLPLHLYADPFFLLTLPLCIAHSFSPQLVLPSSSYICQVRKINGLIVTALRFREKHI